MGTWQDEQMVRRFTRLRDHLPGSESYEVVERLVTDLTEPPRLIVDLGCGAGVLGAKLLERFGEARLVMVDYSPTMLDAARADYGGDSRITIVEADLASISMGQLLGAAKPDAVVSSFALHHLSRQRQQGLYTEIFEALAPGGVFVNCEHTASATPRYERMFYEHLVDGTYRNARAAGEDLTRMQVEAMINDGQDVNILTHVDRQCDWLREIGFADVDCAYKLYEIAVFAGYKPSA
jgi:tRNA (cmo5U34)-methyltransferase